MELECFLEFVWRNSGIFHHLTILFHFFPQSSIDSDRIDKSQHRIYGTSCELDLTTVGLETPVDPAFTQRVRDALSRDRRTQTVLSDRAAREAARMLGPETPGRLEATSTLRARGTTLLIDLDLEGVVESAAH